MLCSLESSMKALIGFGRCYIPSTEGPKLFQTKICLYCFNATIRGQLLEIHLFEDDGLFTPCHSDMQGTEGVKSNVSSLVFLPEKPILSGVTSETAKMLNKNKTYSAGNDMSS